VQTQCVSGSYNSLGSDSVLSDCADVTCNFFVVATW
jgi:hypothetical protein